MLRHHAAIGSDVPARLLYSARSLPEVIYGDELTRLGQADAVDVSLTLTRSWPQEWTGYRGRIDQTLLEEIAWPVTERPLAYVCGPTGFVETATTALVALGYEPGWVRAERFGPTGL